MSEQHVDYALADADTYPSGQRRDERTGQGQPGDAVGGNGCRLGLEVRLWIGWLTPGQGGPWDAVHLVGGVVEFGGDWLVLPDQQLQPAQGGEFSETAVGGRDEEAAAAQRVVDATGVGEQDQLGGIRCRTHAQRRDTELG